MSAINPVITSEQARRITRGRTPLIPVEYDAAIKALEQCCSLDESKYWSDKADALAAWAKIYRNDECVRKAKMLKLHAYRRMGELSAELRPPHNPRKGNGVGRGHGPGPRSLLIDHGLTVAQADAARILGALSERRFDQLLKNPISPVTARHVLRDITAWHQMQHAMMGLRSRCRQVTPHQVSSTMSSVEAENALAMLLEIAEWIDEFETRLKKVKA